jgi:hypothetical protein
MTTMPPIFITLLFLVQPHRPHRASAFGLQLDATTLSAEDYLVQLPPYHQLQQGIHTPINLFNQLDASVTAYLPTDRLSLVNQLYLLSLSYLLSSYVFLYLLSFLSSYLHMIAYLIIAVMSLILSTSSINLSYLSYLKPMAVVCLIILI